MVIDAALTAAGAYLGEKLPGWSLVLLVFNSLLALASASVMFTAIFKVLPDLPVEWHDAWVGGLLTGLMFTDRQVPDRLLYRQQGNRIVAYQANLDC